MQRRIRRDKRSSVKPRLFDILLETKSEKDMIRAAAGLMHELRAIYGMKVVRHSYAVDRPWTFIATVEATNAQIEAFSKRESEAKVVALPPAA